MVCVRAPTVPHTQKFLLTTRCAKAHLEPKGAQSPRKNVGCPSTSHRFPLFSQHSSLFTLAHLLGERVVVGSNGAHTHVFSPFPKDCRSRSVRSRLPDDAEPPPSGLGFPDGLFSFTIVGLTAGETVTVTITLPAALSGGPFSYWKFHSGSWQQMPASKATLDSTRTIITLKLTDGATPDDSDSVAGQITDPGGPSIGTAPQYYPVGGIMLPSAGITVLLPWALVLFVLGVLSVEAFTAKRRPKRR
jgi:hypothetical protein